MEPHGCLSGKGEETPKVNALDLRLVMLQTGVDGQRATMALQQTNNDVVNAIMSILYGEP